MNFIYGQTLAIAGGISAMMFFFGCAIMTFSVML